MVMGRRSLILSDHGPGVGAEGTTEVEACHAFDPGSIGRERAVQPVDAPDAFPYLFRHLGIHFRSPGHRVRPGVQMDYREGDQVIPTSMGTIKGVRLRM